ncbi:bifunctional oligoribonuclease/PAP phosphatase NrnA [Haliscomenobacter sp.]|uniref:DHH family phosphoesterase n=1 Tax=Haliscomenobacter sp. TaxID=2717303 RepID=UPI003364D3D9
MENIQALRNLLAEPKKVVILTHRNPDGDAIGSSLALYHLLKKQGHEPVVVCPSEYPGFLEWMDGVHQMVIYDADIDLAKAEIESGEVFFCLDFNALDRIDKVGEILAPIAKPKVMIDHHLEPESFPDFLLSDTTASSTSELIYDFIQLMGWEALLDIKIGECIFTGIVTDTGSFKYSTSPKLYRTVASLVELGVNDYLLQDLITNSQEEKHLRLLGHCLFNRMEILEEYRTGIITLTKEDYARFDIQRGDTEGIVNYILRIRGIIMAVFITEQPTIVKISLRSKGDFSVQEIAQKHFKGGGHKNASGGASFIGLKATLKKFRELLPEYREALNRINEFTV